MDWLTLSDLDTNWWGLNDWENHLFQARCPADVATSPHQKDPNTVGTVLAAGWRLSLPGSTQDLLWNTPWSSFFTVIHLVEHCTKKFEKEKPFFKKIAKTNCGKKTTLYRKPLFWKKKLSCDRKLCSHAHALPVKWSSSKIKINFPKKTFTFHKKPYLLKNLMKETATSKKKLFFFKFKKIFSEKIQPLFTKKKIFQEESLW